MQNIQKEKQIFQEVYPFTTENISGYFKKLNLKDKTVLTVGSSLDQAFNALLLGAKKITVFDLNVNTERFYKIKKELILSVPRKDLYSEILNQKDIKLNPDVYKKEIVTDINPYLANDYSYNLLRNKLLEERISIVYGDIFDIERYLAKEAYDRIILSNILQYLKYYATREDPYQFLKNNFLKWKQHLNKDGILQLLYLYSYSIREAVKNNNSLSSYNLKRIREVLNEKTLMIDWFNNSFKDNQDAIVTYTKQ